MHLETRQKFLLCIIVVLVMVLSYQINAMINIKSHGGQLNIPFLHSNTVVAKNNQQTIAIPIVANQNSATSNIAKSDPSSVNKSNLVNSQSTSSPQQNEINSETTIDNNFATKSSLDSVNNDIIKNPTSASAITSIVHKNDVTTVTNTAQQNTAMNTANNKSIATAVTNLPTTAPAVNPYAATLNDADKQYIQSMMDKRLAQINDRLGKDEHDISTANTNATKALAIASNISKPASTINQVNNPTTNGQVVTQPTKTAPVMPSLVMTQPNQTPQIQPAKDPSVIVKPVIHKTLSVRSIHQLPGLKTQIMQANPANYTIQVIADSKLTALYAYMNAFCLRNSAMPLHTKRFGKDWYILIYGQFPTVYQAYATLQQFPAEALRWRPFVRRMSDVQHLISNPRGEDALVAKVPC